jgi:hypothetical protein
MLALAPRVGYIHEPFNPRTTPGICAAPFEHFFTYVTRENEAPYYAPVARSLRFSFDVRAQLQAIDGARSAAAAVRDYASFTRDRIARARPLVKDPIAVFSTEWLSERFDMDVVIVVRHPAAFASSLKRLDWRHRFASFLAQPLLLRDHLGGYEDEIRWHVEADRGVIEQAATLWRLIYGTVLALRERHPEWIVVRHEDAARDPIGVFGNLYERLGLEWSTRVRDEVAAHSASSNPSELRSRHDVRLSSSESLGNWKQRLAPEEIAFLRSSVREFDDVWYGDLDW